MLETKCTHCPSTEFEAVRYNIKELQDIPVMILRCKECKIFLSTISELDTIKRENLENDLALISVKLDDIKSKLWKL